MKVRLIGEFSGVHSALAAGLRAIQPDIDVAVVSDGDGWKGHARDVELVRPRRISGPIGKAVEYAGLLTGLAGASAYRENRRRLTDLVGCDVVQLINPVVVEGLAPAHNLALVAQLRRQNARLFLLAAGDDLAWVRFARSSECRYSFLKPLRLRDAASYAYAMKYVWAPRYPALHRGVLGMVDAVIPTAIDYKLAYRREPKAVQMIPFPIDVASIPLRLAGSRPTITVLHGVQRGSEVKKGNRIFDAAMEHVVQVMPRHVRYVRVESLPRAEYSEVLAESDIVLDQVYSHDQGMNALGAMAMGKVVLTGVEREFMEHYGLSAPPAINALPDAEHTARQLVELISNPARLSEIGLRARQFVEDVHDARKVAVQYLQLWSGSAAAAPLQADPLSDTVAGEGGEKPWHRM